MSSKFKRNNYVVYSDSEEETTDENSDSSENEDESESESENADDTSSSITKSPNISQVDGHESRNTSSSSSDKENLSFNTNKASSPLNTRNRKSFIPEKSDTDLNANKFTKKLSGDASQLFVESSVHSEVEDILVGDSSLSLDNDTKSIIADSSNESSDKTSKSPQGENEISKSKVIEESSDSDSSIEYIGSVSSVMDSQQSISPVKEKNNYSYNKEIKVIESPSASSDSIKNISSSTVGSNNILSPSGLSDSRSSVKSTSSVSERRSLERQLADKRAAYQNLMKALRACNPSKLKDGGKLLQEKKDKCKLEIDELKEALKNMGDVSVESSTEKYSPKSNILFSTSDQMTKNLGEKGMQTHRIESALTADALVTLHGSLKTCPPEDALETDPQGLRVSLMPHQKYALAWLLWREQQIPPGGILADDMGLGKTLTMIALVLRSNEYKIQNNLNENESPIICNDVRMYPGKTLVICPTSIMGQWHSQIKQHCKSHLLSTMIHHGNPRELQAKKLAAHDIVITTYGVACTESKIIKGNKKGPLFRVKWERIIIDEGHIIRNHQTKTAQVLCELEAKYRWCLTGTPVQNRELDMYSLLKFLRCSPFDNLAVWKRWVDNKTENGVQRLNTVVKSILLRRTKEELKKLGELEELPAKKLIPVYIKLDEEEQEVYHTVLNFSKTLLAEYISQKQNKFGFVSDELQQEFRRLMNSANEIKTAEIFVLLLRLRQICCLPGLIHSMLEKDSCKEDGIDPEDDPILQDLTSQMKRMSVGLPNFVPDEIEKKKKILIETNPVFQINRVSGKIRKVLEIIKEAIRANDKIVIVSQWASLLQKIKPHVVSLNVGVVTLDGSVQVKLRPSIIENFNNKNSDVKVMLLSLTAGGVGLNLVGGNRLVIFEPHWNPQLEAQACDRIYRVGQKKEVYIYKIICQETIEERIEQLQKKKLELADTVLKGEMTRNKNQLTLADLKILFDIHS